MSEHTPLPWRESEYGEVITPVYDSVVAKCGCQKDTKFIVRACNSYDDLLAALEHIEEICDTRESALHPIRDIARDAIKKANNTQVAGQGIRPASSD